MAPAGSNIQRENVQEAGEQEVVHDTTPIRATFVESQCGPSGGDSRDLFQAGARELDELRAQNRLLEEECRELRSRRAELESECDTLHERLEQKNSLEERTELVFSEKRDFSANPRVAAFPVVFHGNDEMIESFLHFIRRA